MLQTPDFPADIKQRVERLLNSCSGRSLGAYSESQGLLAIREDVAKYIEERDGFPARPSDIYLCNGASDGIKTIIKLLMNTDPKKPSGIVSERRRDETNDLITNSAQMIPVPQYPLYSATLAEYGAYQIAYYLDEEHNWALNIEELERALEEAKDRCVPRGIVIINPGNPTGKFELINRFASLHRPCRRCLSRSSCVTREH